jgi:hypothetical protein
MKVEKVFIRDIDIPLKQVIVRWFYYGGVMTIEVDLDVHPTIVNFIDMSGFIKERVRIISENQTEMAGKFTIHTETSSILLISEINEVEGAEQFTPINIKSGTFLPPSDEDVSISNELKTKQKSILITLLTFLLDGELKDKGNREFIYTLVEKLKSGQRPSKFDQYLINRICCLLEDTIIDSQHFSPHITHFDSK